MKKFILGFTACVVGLWCLGAIAENVFAQEKVNECLHGNLDAPIVLACSGRVVILDKNGNETFRYDKGIGNLNDVEYLPNGNILFADGDSVVEVTPDKDEILHFVADDKRPDSMFSAERLENGNTLIGWNSQNKVIEIDRTGKVVRSFDCQFLINILSHNNNRNVRITKSGTVLVAQKDKGVIAEYSRDGELLKTFNPGPGNIAFGVKELSDGSILGSFLSRLVIFDRSGKEIWRLEKSDLPEIEISMMCALDVRNNGNIVVGNYAANKGEYHAAMAFEVTRDKKLVWYYLDPKGPYAVLGVQVLEK